MPQTSKTVTINGKTYEIFNIPPTAALKSYFKLQKLLLGPVGDALNASGSLGSLAGALDKNIDLGSAFQRLAESIDPQELTNLFKELIETGAHFSGVPISFETHFMGNIAEVFLVVKEVINFNYPNFFGMLFGLVDLSKLPDSTRAPSPTNP